ncbi:urease accessory protein UreF [Amorphus orientalis]|uniref:urease accessory protein UreF n=1 Tax=Amorphus orientalis TaxID=649198 RepID=UPI00351F8D97
MLAEDRAAGADAVLGFIREQLRLRFLTADRVALVRALELADDEDALAAVDRAFHAASPIEPHRTASLRNGAALLAAHVRLGTAGAVSYQRRIRVQRAFGHLPVVQGLVFGGLGLGEGEAVRVAGYGLVMGMAQAALRLGRIGAIDAQRVIADALADLEAIADEPVGDAAPASFTPLSDIAAIGHARHRGRLFAS